MHLIDSFYYSSEPIAYMRLVYLADIVDKFIIFESSISMNGLKKSMDADYLKKSLPQLADKIEVIQIPEKELEIADLETCILPNNKSFVMGYIQKTLENMLADDDILHFSMADEMPLHEIFEFTKLNHQKLPYPVALLGDHIYGSVYDCHAVTDKMCHQNRITTKAMLAEKGLEDYHITLIKTDNGINAIKQGTPLNLDKKAYNNASNLKPLMIKCEDFMSVPAFYQNILMNCQIVGAKLQNTPYYKDNILDKAKFQEFISASFDDFKEKLAYMAHHLQVVNTQRHKYILDILPPELYQFGVQVAQDRMMTPSDTLLKQYYDGIYQFAN